MRSSSRKPAVTTISSKAVAVASSCASPDAITIQVQMKGTARTNVLGRRAKVTVVIADLLREEIRSYREWGILRKVPSLRRY
jgi:hypothetical protein